MKPNNIHAWFFLVVFLKITACGPGSDHNQKHNDHSHLYEIVKEIEIDSVWAANRVWFSLQTVGNKQFVAYYDKNRMMTVASREIGSDKSFLPWQRYGILLTGKVPNRLLWRYSGVLHRHGRCACLSCHAGRCGMRRCKTGPASCCIRYSSDSSGEMQKFPL